jgi:signal transduction histidine kinase
MSRISIAAMYYQTSWFRTLVAVAATALVWGAYRWRVRQLRRAFAMTLDARVGERTRIARELHDTLRQSLHALVLRFQTVLNLLPDRPEDARQRLEAALERADEAITEGRNAVQGLRNSTVEKNDLALALRTLGEDLSNEASVDRPAAFTVTLEGDSRALHPIVRDEIYNIAAEAIRNAFRHAGAERIDVRVQYAPRQFRLVVRDDGKGLDPAVLAAMNSQGHYGLCGMRERAGVIGGRLVVWSERGQGTEVELRVPTRAAPVGARTGM